MGDVTEKQVLRFVTAFIWSEWTEATTDGPTEESSKGADGGGSNALSLVGH